MQVLNCLIAQNSYFELILNVDGVDGMNNRHLCERRARLGGSEIGCSNTNAFRLMEQGVKA